LTVWNPDLAVCHFVEVKGPSDRLSAKQILWIEYLNNHGITSIVCHVEAMNARKLPPSKSGCNESPQKKKNSPRKPTPKKTPPKSKVSTKKETHQKKASPKRRACQQESEETTATTKTSSKRKSKEKPSPKTKRTRNSSGDDFEL
jgi:hypothetical protein